MKKNAKICLILGTRPEIIKLSPIIRLLKKRKADYRVVHSDQHYSYRMDTIFFKELGLPKPDHQLKIPDRSAAEPGRLFAAMVAGIEKVLLKEKPRFVLVQGDTNTVLAGALAANRLSYVAHHQGWKIQVGHVEAGLRSHDLRMPEEMNRLLADRLSDFLFVPTSASRVNLLKEGVAPKKVIVTGNTVVDAVLQNLVTARKKSKVLEKYRLRPRAFGVMTLHRPEGVDHRDRLAEMIDAAGKAGERHGLELIFPVHPRTEGFIRGHKIPLRSSIRMVAPTGYFDFLRLLSESRIALTDSGGVQEEVCVLGIPCVTLRENTERPETVACGGNRIAGIRSAGILDAVEEMLKRKEKWRHGLGSGDASERILDYLAEVPA